MKQSAGILLYRFNKEPQFLLAHPGGPFWAKKDNGAWTIPKGELAQGEEPLNAAKREFAEETGHEVSGNFILLDPVKQKGGKLIHAWAVEGDFDPALLKSNEFEMAWPPRSEVVKRFPEIDRVAWFSKETAMTKILPGQQGFIQQLAYMFNV